MKSKDELPLLAKVSESQPPFAQLLEIEITHATRDRLEAKLHVKKELTNRRGGLHGGVVMALADNLGGTAATFNLQQNEETTTLESKTNFFSKVAVGSTIYAECTPLHRGRVTMVWQTKVSREDGKLVALTVQTQMITRTDSAGR